MSTEQQNVPAFDLIGKRYDESFVERDVQLAEGAWLIRQLPPGARVLDLGCGSGLPTAKQLLDAGVEVVGVDESQVMLQLAEQQAPGGRYLHQDLRDVDELGEFDAVVAFFALLMLPRADIPPLLERIRARLRGPKLLLISMVHGDFDLFPIVFLGAPTGVSAYPPATLRQVVTDAGYEVLDLQEIEAEAEPGRIEVQIYLRARALD
ncbi:MAG TPA: class I SAM-dependent methyltransferase [Actinophytocola sp.]|uniref:class I SAM-dependent DNA methyltransferase n=1 Tax=Actinophytocola sp. TaxID=1872138 RepID=UPI002DDCC8C6|nr:class I SAM-dependent methyltransferase [Actinophytocola sp.]HEV2781733.1 class I SAM-dependent methyltransferase [Actinophytocola sp.]